MKGRQDDDDDDDELVSPGAYCVSGTVQIALPVLM